MQSYKTWHIVSMQYSTLCNTTHIICTECTYEQNHENAYILVQLHACLTQVTFQTTALHVVVLTFALAVVSPCSLLLAPLSSRCGGGRQFHSPNPAIFPPAATYMLSHLLYPSQCCPWWQDLHVNMFQSLSNQHPAEHSGLQSHLEDKRRMSV